MTSRWWVYQRERFPVLTHGVLIGAFSFAGISYSAALRGDWAAPRPRTMLVAFASAFLFFLQLRLLDEFKDSEEDAAYRPYRPVPRGLVTLRELGWVGVAAAAVQLVLSWWLHSRLLALLGGVWGYLGLMRVEFFAPEWLKARPALYVGSHMIIVPLIALYVTACDWIDQASGMPAGLEWFLLASFFNGLVIELGRKIRAPGDEEPGVPTYSQAWGIPVAIAAWLAALIGTGTCAVWAGIRIGMGLPIGVAVTLVAALALAFARDFIRQPLSRGARRIDHLSGGWALLLYVILGSASLVSHL